MQGFGLARIGRDVETRPTKDGDTVANVSLAFTYGRKGADGKRPTQWVDGTLWGKRAEALAQYLTKGTSVAVTLEDVALETYTGSDNVERTKMVARIANIELAGSPAAAAAPPPPPPSPPPKPRPVAVPSNGGFDDMNDDIPFVLSLNDFCIPSSKERRLSRCEFK